MIDTFAMVCLIVGFVIGLLVGLYLGGEDDDNKPKRKNKPHVERKELRADTMFLC